MRIILSGVCALFFFAACEQLDEPSDAALPSVGQPDDARRDAGGQPTVATTSDAARDSALDAALDAAPGPRLDAAHHDSDAGEDDEDADQPPSRSETFVYVGGWDWSGTAYPFQNYVLDRRSGELQLLGISDVGQNPSYSVRSADNRFLYIVNEWDETAGVTTASLTEPPHLARAIAHQSFDGARGLVFASLDPAGKFLFATSYAGGAVVVYPILPDGALGAAVDTHTFTPPAGEAEAQTHSVRVHPSGKWAYVPNKALDSVAQFALAADSGKLTPLSPAVLPTGENSEPRHIALTADGRFALIAFEGSSRLGSYRVSDYGTLNEIDVRSLLPDGFSGSNTGAHVLVHPNNKLVYASNRGHDSIAVFALADDGKLTLLEHEPSLGRTPRHFDIDTSGTLLVVANQGEAERDGSLAVFDIEPDGKLSPRGKILPGLLSPNSVSIVERPK